MKRLAGQWKIKKAENTRPYYESLGINTFVAGIVSKLSADIQILLTDSGFNQISTTNGLIQKTVEQQFKFDQKTIFYNPLTRGNEVLTVDQTHQTLRLLFAHEAWLFKSNRLSGFPRLEATRQPCFGER